MSTTEQPVKSVPRIVAAVPFRLGQGSVAERFCSTINEVLKRKVHASSPRDFIPLLQDI